MRVLWICGLPEDVRLNALPENITNFKCAAWSWVLGHFPPPRDVELHVLCPVLGLHSRRIDFDYKGVAWHCVRQDRYEASLLWLRVYYKAKKIVDEIKPQVIHGWGGETGCGWVATLLTRNAVVSVQGLLLLLFWQLMKIKNSDHDVSLRTRLAWFCERMTYKRARVLLVESSASNEGLKRYYSEEGLLIPHPLRQDFLECDLSSRASLEKAQIKFVYVGNLTERKGAIDAIMSFKSLSSRNAELVMIGEGKDAEVIKKLIIEYGLLGKVRLRGTLSAEDIVSEFKSAQFFLLPSYGDTGPTALKEALSCGLYPICYDNSGPKALVSHYGCGKLVKTGDVDSLANVISESMDNVKTCLDQGLSAASLVRDELNKDKIWEQLRLAYA